MEPYHAILAAGGEGFGQLIVIAVLVVIGIVGSALKKTALAKEAEQAQEAARRRREAAQREGQQAAAPPAPSKAARRAAAAAHAVQTPPPSPRRATLGEGVDDEMADFSRRQDAMQASRQSRLHLHEPDAALADTQASLSVPRAGIRLQGSALAQAVILREILSPPKALRKEQEMWEL